jgi:protein-tyrosine phosphatase/membrane-associated phospholipid phosphatase
VGHLQRVGGDPHRELRLRAAIASALLSALFLVGYGGANWLAAQRAHVGNWYFGWELGIPLVPAMIVPYMTIDLFFVAAPFVCQDRRELSTFTNRVVFEFVVAIAFFVAMPLTIAFPREPVAGLFGPIFTWFRGMDAPFNLFPSLHIALRTLLAQLYARHTRGPLWLTTAIWFSLIGFSTVLTHQHHLVDIAGGFALAGVAFYLFRDEPMRRPVVPNPRIGAYYAATAPLMVAAAIAIWPWGAFLLPWVVGLAMIVAGYFGLGPGVYRKENGRLPLSCKFVLAPVLFGQWLSLRHYARHARPWDEVAPGVWIGRVLSDAEAAQAVEAGVTAVLDLTCEFAEAKLFRSSRYYNLPILDLTAPTQEQMAEGAAIIAAEAARGVVYVHCKIGYSRSAAVVGAYLLANGQVTTADAAIDQLQAVRPGIFVRPEARQAIESFAACGISRN